MRDTEKAPAVQQTIGTEIYRSSSLVVKARKQWN